MFDPITDLRGTRILVSNDDGIDAPGIKVLEKVARTLSDDVWVVAPASEQSAVAHSLTVRRPLRIHQVSDYRFSVDGTPTDSVLVGVRQILADKRPTLVLSGINRGGNLGDDVTYSGTVAAAMEGTLLGIPSIAFSQVFEDRHPVKWATAEHWAPEVIRRLCSTGWPGNVLINVNFPDMLHGSVKGVCAARQGKRAVADSVSERFDPRGDAYYWIGGQRAMDRGQPGSDLDAVGRGYVSVTPLCVDFTHAEALGRLETLLG
ncbi:MAG TPA: 5'/3'-nucleotidase SurE [Candidatus Sulfotelmatobacter sp.]|jgi:5'-nucleotidase|nr:5'/3'-nucleotidase SurE [Candidatus Sulfotelmatobacter sp.]